MVVRVASAEELVEHGGERSKTPDVGLAARRVVLPGLRVLSGRGQHVETVAVGFKRFFRSGSGAVIDAAPAAFEAGAAVVAAVLLPDDEHPASDTAMAATPNAALMLCPLSELPSRLRARGFTL